MQLGAFHTHFGGLGESFWATFPHPFLIEAGKPDDTSRQVYMVRAEEGDRLVVGRGAGCAVRLKDRLVSSRHFELLHPAEAGAPWRISDLGSTNGTLVDGETLDPNTPSDLPDRARLLLGPGVLYAFHLPVSVHEILDGLGTPAGRKGTEADGQTIRSEAFLGDLTPDQDEEAPARGSLFLFCDPYDPMPLPPGAVIVLGRVGGKAQLVLPDKHISRLHAHLEGAGDRVLVRDLGSANGTYLAGARLGQEEVELIPGQRLTVGSFKLRVAGKAGAGGVLTGRLEVCPLQDVLQQILDQERTGSLRVHGADDAVRGLVICRDGRPTWASVNDEELTGVPAIRMLVQLGAGSFELRPEILEPRHQLIPSISQILASMEGDTTPTAR